jgi:hypothetical protein
MLSCVCPHLRLGERFIQGGGGEGGDLRVLRQNALHGHATALLRQ